MNDFYYVLKALFFKFELFNVFSPTFLHLWLLLMDYLEIKPVKKVEDSFVRWNLLKHRRIGLSVGIGV